MKIPSAPVLSGRLKTIRFSSSTEQILRGGRHLFPLIPKAMEGINQIGIIGFKSQGKAQAQNWRDTLKFLRSNITVKVGLRANSESLPVARAAGFTEQAGTLGEMYEVIASSDLVILLIQDGAQVENWKKILAAMKPGATLGLSHGFLLGHLKSIAKKFRPDISVILMAPKGMGNSVRKLYQQGRKLKGAGINSSVAVLQDRSGRGFDRALAWALATGSPVTFFTTMEREYLSDLTGERGDLLGAMWGLAEALYERFLWSMNEREAFLRSTKGLTSTVAELISKLGLLGTYKKLQSLGLGEAFEYGYRQSYGPSRNLVEEIYREVRSGREIKEVVAKTKRKIPMSNIETHEMWRVGKNLYDTSVPWNNSLAIAAGMYIGCMMAQMHVLLKHGHCVSEVVNESLIEIVDSLLPFMDRKGVSYMVDNCSWTARLGTRKWGPRFKAAFTKAMSGRCPSRASFTRFLKDPLHGDIKQCYRLRPTVKLIVD